MMSETSKVYEIAQQCRREWLDTDKSLIDIWETLTDKQKSRFDDFSDFYWSVHLIKLNNAA